MNNCVYLKFGNWVIFNPKVTKNRNFPESFPDLLKWVEVDLHNSLLTIITRFCKQHLHNYEWGQSFMIYS